MRKRSKIGIKETKDLVKFTVRFIKIVNLAQKTKRFSPKRKQEFEAFASDLYMAAKGVEKVKEELSDVVREQYDEIFKLLEEEFGKDIKSVKNKTEVMRRFSGLLRVLLRVVNRTIV